jgi:hypothetical protein
MSSLPTLPSHPKIPAPTVIVRDVALAGMGVVGLSFLSGQALTCFGVAAGVLLAVGSVRGMVWVVDGAWDGSVMGRLGLQTVAVLMLCYVLLSMLPVLPVLLGYGSLVVGLLARTLLSVREWRPTPVAEEIQ